MVQRRHVLLALWLSVSGASWSTAQVDDRMARINEGGSPRVFAVDTAPVNTVTLGRATEVRQERPPHNYAVLVRNLAGEPASAVTVTLAVVLSDGSVKAFQDVPAIKNLKLGQTRRLETRVRGAVLSPTDRIVFVVKTLQLDGGSPLWQVNTEDLRALIQNAAQRMPVP